MIDCPLLCPDPEITIVTHAQSRPFRDPLLGVQNQNAEASRPLLWGALRLRRALDYRTCGESKETTGTSTALALVGSRWLSSDREQSPAPGASAPPACCYTLTLALRGIAAAYLGLQCLDPARLCDTLIPRRVGASIAARFLTAL